MNANTHIRFVELENLLPTLAQRFSAARPFEHVVFDGFLHPESLDRLQAAIARPIEENRSNDYMFARNKFENPAFADDGGVMAEIKDELLSDRFAAILSQIFGKPLFVDPSFLGGGIHQGGQGSFLDMHADFSRHPIQNEWMREINILVYLNKDYHDAYGGHLELQHAQTAESDRVAPIENRLVLMLTKQHTLHGYKAVSFPEGAYRTSLAAYAYSLDSDFESVPARSTLWKPQDAGLTKLLIAKVSPALVKLKNSFFGSRTARRAAGDSSKKKENARDGH